MNVSFFILGTLRFKRTRKRIYFLLSRARLKNNNNKCAVNSNVYFFRCQKATPCVTVYGKKRKEKVISLLFAADIIEIHALGNVDDCIMQHQLLKIVKAFERATRRNDLDAIGAMEV